MILAVAIAVAATAAALLIARQAHRPQPPPAFGVVPAFALTERSGREIRRADLDGGPWIADFIFTRCTGMCPALSSRMAELRRRVADTGLPARFVSFSVDPAHDTPAVLRDYARRVGADGDDWLFLTGPRDALYDLIGGGFRLSVSERAPDAVAVEGGELIAHSDRFVLVDGVGQIRGYYHGLEPTMPEAVIRDLRALADDR
ncbi:SCO family protein [bacterium]|nr:SCO family protein [bacterium]